MKFMLAALLAGATFSAHAGFEASRHVDLDAAGP